MRGEGRGGGSALGELVKPWARGALSPPPQLAPWPLPQAPNPPPQARASPLEAPRTHSCP